MSQWIKCSERMPEEDEEVFVYPPSARTHTFFFVKDGWEYGGFRHDLERFTHWMPLPKPPTEEPKK